tara:strand:- start:28 stop:1575 length:1548 start_codon:yes stop_codon:yes gene_type:complete
MVLATYTLRVDWDNNDILTGTGEDVTARLMELEWWRGRDYPSQLTGRSIGGKLRATLLNTSKDYSSFNTLSPIAGNIVPGRKVRLDGGSGSFPYTFPIVFNDKPHFVGFLDSLEPIPDIHGRNVAELVAIGPLAYLNEKEVQLAMATSKATGTAIGDILDDTGWPSGDRTLDTGQTTMDRFWVDRQKTIAALRLVEETEGGFIYEGKDGKIVFQDRHARLKSPHTTSQATFSDASGAARSYMAMPQLDPFAFIFNEFEATIQTYTVASIATLWTLSESGSSSPKLAPGESRDFWAVHPTPDSATNVIAVDAWTTPAENTDYEANSASDGNGTDHSADLTVTVSKFSESMKISITNGAAVAVFITLLQARGTAVTRDDPVKMISEDTTSQTAYGERTFPSRSRFIPNTTEGKDWADFNLSIYKDPIPLLRMRVNGNRDHNNLVEVLTRDIGDRVTIVATGDAGLGINEDFFIESEHHLVDENRHHWAEWTLSPADGYSNFWILDTSKLDTETALAY